MKRYAVFGGPGYYPMGGWDDLLKRFDAKVLAIAWAAAWYDAGRGYDRDWCHVIDLETGEEVWEGPGSLRYNSKKD